MTIKTYATTALPNLLYNDGYETLLFPGTLVKRWVSGANGVVVSNCDRFVTILFDRPFEDMYAEDDIVE